TTAAHSATSSSSATPAARTSPHMPLPRGNTPLQPVDALHAAGNRSAQSDSPASATTDATQSYVLTPVADAYVKSDVPDSTFGTSLSLLIKTASVPTPQDWRAFLRFDLSGISGTVQSATFSVPYYCTHPRVTGFTVH